MSMCIKGSHLRTVSLLAVPYFLFTAILEWGEGPEVGDSTPDYLAKSACMQCQDFGDIRILLTWALSGTEEFCD